MLNKQVYVYSLDTASFYNENEMKIHKKMTQAHIIKSKLIKKKSKKSISDTYEEILKNRIAFVNTWLKDAKATLYSLLESNSEIRSLNEDDLVSKNVVSVFDSVLSRTIGAKEKEITKDIIIVQTYYFQVLEQLIKNGFYYGTEKYICFTASAGQIRTKKTIFIKESIWRKYEKTLTCGLTIEEINSKGGMNTNKFLAYLALCNSATDEWKSFNIKKSIVVEDLETMVTGVVDHIDDKTFEIERKEMSVPIPHTDGCGMILPKKSKKSFMVRLPFVKGLLSPFDFLAFGKQFGSTKVVDIYGIEHDIEKEGIEVIFTRSQFKMAKYYNSWTEYQEKFKEFNCQAAICNIEEDIIPEAKLNYQMLQTLPDMTNEELGKIAYETNSDIIQLSNCKDTMLRILGADKSNMNKNHLQEALALYPSMLNDSYSKEVIKAKKKSLVTNAKAGKLNIEGKYTFIIPDLYAFCEYLFLGQENPKGLLKNGEVSCHIYINEQKLDCLRSPHLYCEHAVRKNTINEETSKWFITKGLYTSIHDLISRELQFDCDGDKSLVCVDETLIAVAERNMKDVVPLYYEMATANKELINMESIYNGLQAAYKGNIGIISNDISKIWNSEEPNIEAIKWLTAFNNYVIDYAKSLYLPTIPKEKKKIINGFTKNKLPHFFKYAKKKDKDKVSEVNNSTVNRLEEIISNKSIQFKKVAGVFNYTYLMKNKNTEIDQEIIDRYTTLDRSKKWLMKDEDSNKSNEVLYVYSYIRDELLKLHSDPNFIADVLVKYLYEKDSSRKKTLWECFGEELVTNLKKSIKGRKACESCGKMIKVTNNRAKYCRACWKEREKEIKRNSWNSRKN